MICIKCGFKNKDGANFCKQCNARLPKDFKQAEKPATPKITGRYEQIKEIADKTGSGEISPQEFVASLEQLAQILNDWESKIRSVDIPKEALPDFQEELEIGFAGIELYQQGIAEMKNFAEDLNREHITQGLAMVSEGNEKLNRAMELNRQTVRKRQADSSLGLA